MNLARRSLIDTSDLSRDEIVFLFDETQKLKKFTGHSDNGQTLSSKSVALIFFEPSTRTRTSFEMAAFRLGLRVLNLDGGSSSAQKGETIFDTARNVEA